MLDETERAERIRLKDDLLKEGICPDCYASGLVTALCPRCGGTGSIEPQETETAASAVTVSFTFDCSPMRA